MYNTANTPSVQYTDSVERHTAFTHSVRGAMSTQIERALLSGLLVGIGAALGNGCTSGHGICGNARLSPRSMLFTLAFMAAGKRRASPCCSHEHLLATQPIAD